MEQARYTYSREDLLECLCEPFGSLSAEEISAAEALAGSDPEVALALNQCRAMSRMAEASIYGQPPTNDAEFIVALRGKLSEPERAPVVRGAFGTRGLVGAAASVCVVVLVVIFAAGSRIAPPIEIVQPQVAQALESFASAVDPASTLIPDSISNTPADAESLAVYLDMPDLASNWDLSTDSTDLDQPLSDELLSLDTQTLQEVLNDLENTNFF